jgi:hydrogenase maturation protease
VTVIGLGNSEMGDDGVGVALVEMLRAELEAGMACPRAGGAEAPLRLVTADRDPVYAGACVAEGGPALLVDAVDMGREPGACRLFRPGDADFPATPRGGSTHALAGADIVEMARALGCADGLRLMGIQFADMAPGRGLSPALQGRLPGLLETIKQEVGLLP